jgi:ribosome biogenesis GTPase A
MEVTSERTLWVLFHRFRILWKGEKEMSTINWYPGHMKKTRELIGENLKAVDLVLEVLDARIPQSSRNPILDELIKNKRRIVVFNKSDLADKIATDQWIQAFQHRGVEGVRMNAMSGKGIKELYKRLDSYREEKNAGRQVKKPFRIMIVGVPNVGKSSLINRLTGRKSTQTGDRPGVTKGKQWLTMENGMQLLDTPGILWPKFEDPLVGRNLAFCGSIKDEIMDLETLALELIEVLSEKYPQLLQDRYRLESIAETPLATMENIATKRGYVQAGKRFDYQRTARTLLDEFRSGQIGTITLEMEGEDSQ